LALLGYAGIPVEDRPKSQLPVTEAASVSINGKLPNTMGDFALMHPAAAFATKEWPAEKYARTAEFLADRYGLHTVAVASKSETHILTSLMKASRAPVTVFDDLTLPEITALAARARLFVGNDSGIAHIAAAVDTPVVVIFGSSNRQHWYPWTDAPNRMVYNEIPREPDATIHRAEFADPRSIVSIEPERVFAAISQVLSFPDPKKRPE
jgi:heptosyltransferase-2/heptosyltransferase-3